MPTDLSVLDGLLAELPPVGPLPRTVRPTVAPQAAWGCAYCGGAAGPECDELTAKGRTWRVCSVCANCPDTSEGRLLDMLTTKGGLALEIARATSALARHEGFRLPMRYEDLRCRPNHRPQPRWHHLPASAVDALMTFAEHRRPPVTPVVMPAQRPARRVHPGMLMNEKAWAMLAWPPDAELTALQVGQALQLAPPTLSKRGLSVGKVAELLAVFADPPLWLLDLHRLLATQRATNQARQTAVARAGNTAPVAPTSDRDARLVELVDALFTATEPDSRSIPALPGRPLARAQGRPHPQLLVSARAQRLLALPADHPLSPAEIGRAATRLLNLDPAWVGHLHSRRADSRVH